MLNAASTWTSTSNLALQLVRGLLQHLRVRRVRVGLIIHASRALRETIPRPKISRNEWNVTEIGTSVKVWVLDISCTNRLLARRAGRGQEAATAGTEGRLPGGRVHGHVLGGAAEIRLVPLRGHVYGCDDQACVRRPPTGQIRLKKR